MKKLIATLLLALFAVGITGCTTEADMASKNLKTAAEQFEVDRRIVFYNGITDTYMLTIEGRCSVESNTGRFEVTCRVGPDEYKIHYLGLSDNVSYVVEQLEPAQVDVYRYRVIFRPETIVPDIDLETSADG